MQPGYIQADNGKKIGAYKQVGGSPAYKCDCHGLTFGDGKYWINNDQVNALLKGDGYAKTKTPQPGDVAIFKAGGEVVHSLTVTAVDDKGNVTQVTGLGGTEPSAHSNTPEQIEQEFGKILDKKMTVEYYHDAHPDRPTPEKLDQVKKYEKQEQN
jgi:CHAP domain-containing protein